MTNNFWLGSNELCIIYRDGRHLVVERYMDYDVVFDGTYADCLDYCKSREIEYLENTIG